MAIIQVRDGYKDSEIGIIPIHWDVSMIGDHIQSLEAGVSVNSENRPATNFEKGVLKTSATTRNKFESSENKVIIPDDIERARVSPQKDSLIVSRMNTPDLVGATGYVDSDYPNLFLPDRLWMAQIKKNTSAQWLYYVLISDSMKEQLRNTATGTSGSMKNLSKPAFSGLKIPLPPLPEQQKIADILSTIDEHITETEFLIEKTKILKQGMMQRLLTKGIDNTEFKDTEFGRIPVEWEVVSFGSICACRNEKYMPSADESKKYVALEHIDQATGRLIGVGVSNESCSLKTAFRVNDVLFGKLRPYLKKYWLAQFDGVCSTEIFAFSAKDKVLPAFLLYFVEQDSFVRQATGKSYGTKMPRASWDDIQYVLVPLPSLHEQNHIASILNTIDDQIGTYQAKLETLTQLKLGLMQQLLTGKIRVKVGQNSF